MSDDSKIRKVMELYGDTIFRICLIQLKNHADAEDAVQETFITYYSKAPDFADCVHEKSWLIKVAFNKCRDIMRFRKRHETEPEELLSSYIQEEENRAVLEALMCIPDKFSKVMSLYYIEGFKITEIAEMLNKSPSAVKMRLQKGRKLLEEVYRKEFM